MLYQSLPATWEDAKPIVEQILQQSASTVSKVSGSSRRRPDPPRDLQVVIGTLDVTVSWTPPANPVDIVGWRIYKDNESNLIDRIADASTTQDKIKLSVSTPTAFYVSSVNAIGLESIKVQALGTPADALGAEPNSVVAGPTEVTNSLTNGGALGQYVQGLSVKFPGEIQFDVEVAKDGSNVNQIVDVLLFASAGTAGPNGYFARFDSRAGFAAGQLLRVDNGTWHNIGSQIAGNNPGILQGWHHITLRLGANGVMDLWVDGIYQFTATDQTYSPTGVLYYGMEVTNLSNPVLAPPQFVNRQLDQVPDGKSFGRTPASNYSVQTPSGKVTGFQVLSNPDFENGSTNYHVYDNNGSGSVGISLVADTAAPGGMGQKLKIVESAVGAGPTPGLGGFFYSMILDNGTIFADGYHVGDTYIIDLVANIPVGYTLNFGNNSLGTGGSFTWLSQRVGTGNWQHYIGKVIIGTSPSTTNAFPFFYLTGTDGVTWYAGQMVIIDIDQTQRMGGISTVVGADGTKFGPASGWSSAGIGNLVHAGNIRTYLTGTPQWGFYGSPSFAVHTFGSSGEFQQWFPAAGRVFNVVNSTISGGRRYSFKAESDGTNGIGDETAAVTRTILNSTPNWGFYGSPGVPVESFANGANFRGTGAIPFFSANNTNSSGRNYSFVSGDSTVTQSIDDSTAGASRTILNNTPQWGFYGSPGVPVDISAGSEQTLRCIGADPGFSMNDTQTSGVVYGISNGISSAGGVGKFSINQTGTAVRTVMNTTPQWGMFATPAVDLDLGGQNFRASSSAGQVNLQANFTGASGRGWAFTSGGSAAGVQNIVDVTGNANRTYMNANPNWGFYGTPTHDVDQFGRTLNIQASQPLTQWNDTQASGRAFYESSGSAAVGVFGINDNTAGSLRTYLNATPQLGIYGTPGQALHVFGGANPSEYIDIQNATTNTGIRVNYNGASGRQYGFLSGFPGAANWVLYDHSGGGQRQIMDGSGNIDLHGSTPASGLITAAGGNISDTSGNLKLKNISSPTPTTSGPATVTTAYAVIAEMTTTITTKGNNVLLLFSLSVVVGNSGHGNCTGALAFFRDGSQVGPTFIVTVIDTGLPEQTPAFHFIDSPSAASHTYDVRWKVTVNTTAGMGNDTTARSFQVTELG